MHNTTVQVWCSQNFLVFGKTGKREKEVEERGERVAGRERESFVNKVRVVVIEVHLAGRLHFAKSRDVLEDGSGGGGKGGRLTGE